MAVDAVAAPVEPAIKEFRRPGNVLAGFVGRGISKSAVVVAYAFAAYTAASILGYTRTYTTAAARAALAASFGSNPGLNALIGMARQIETARGFTAWRTLGVLTIVGAIWALLAATKRFRGEEEGGRLEIFLSGRTTSGGAAANILAGLGVGLLIIYVMTFLAALVAGNFYKLHFGASESLFFSLALVASVAEFFAVGALASQIAATRRRAAGIAAAVFGAFFLLRAIGDAAPSVHWLTYLSPLGWNENLHALTGSSPIWLLPITGFVVLLCALAIYLAERRDLGASILPDSDTAKARVRFLNNPFDLGVRETRGSLAGWLAAIAALSMSTGAIAKTAGQALRESTGALKFFSTLSQSQRAAFGTNTYLGVVFLMVMTVIMGLAASSVGAMREDEAEGYLDHLLVRPVSRMRWLVGRLVIVVISVILAGLVAGIFTWLGAAIQHSGVSFSKMCEAGINSTLPAAVIIGLGILTFGIKPRWTSAVMYAVIGWSFLMELIGPAINLNHWVLDTSLFHHVALVPATATRWSTAWIYGAIGLVAAAIGAAVFNRRDLAGK